VRADANALKLLFPLYVGLFVMAASTIAALGLAIETEEFILRAYALVTIGLVSSLLGAVIGRNPSLVGALIASVVFPLLVLANTGVGITRFFFPDETLGEHSLLLPTLAVWGIIALSFAQVNRANSIFIFVCGLVVYGLTGTVNLNESLLIAFFIFLLSTFFVWSYNGTLNLREHAESAGQRVPLQPTRWAHTQTGVAVALVAVVFVASVLTGYPTYATTRNFFVGPFAPRNRLLAQLPVLRNYAGFSDEFVLAGGPITLDDTPALTVRSDAPALWRGLAYDSYTQHGWRRTLSGPDLALPEVPRGSGRFQLWPANWNLPRTPRVKRIHQTITVHTPTTGVLIAAAAPVSVHGISSALPPAVDNFGCLHARSRTFGELTYEVESLAAAPTVEEMRGASDTYPDLVREFYLPVPPGTAAELQGLADRLTSGSFNAYDKVKAIESYLYTECRYTLDVPPIPMQHDAVAYFLLKTRRGACDLYASSLVVLARLSGVPARVVTGYATGEEDADQGVYNVTTADAHAWAEVYFPGIGWVEFDPPVQRDPDRLSWIRKLFAPGWTGPALRAFAKRAGLVLILLVLVNALILAVSGASPTQLGARWWRLRRHAANPRQRIALGYLAVCQQLARRGRKRSGWQTPTDFARDVAAAQALPDGLRTREVPQFTEEFLRLRYGEAGPSPDEVAAFAQRAQHLARRIRRSKRSGRRSGRADSAGPPRTN
jgi:transglutaminase-like putative cysteine protease